ncbi:hypothetical protein R1sor_012623 [Riccia sorocarpa]|uniref:Uncharacterized protein n=1 Tax=Riccia sorocarpa TaxID=122646 RepID=A0ABD3I8B7_9MARC
MPSYLIQCSRFLLLALIIPGPKKIKNIDIYLEPLVEELQQLWTGVDDVYDGHTERIGRDRYFTLKATLERWRGGSHPHRKSRTETMIDFTSFTILEGLNDPTSSGPHAHRGECHQVVD